ncbi:hypothetical protein K469DRAFT_732140 [Zopfia rhizophila CBS 207.26]|uniref:Uncharacterized protein n=1 Tax=Zopfia rhizophila CBS 207.26 TaxID=1314779 RepID=A0A6A6DG93_9PEZI|nr:hypothetical protein K469DRAFT_732140 [Zopfia rhizophila CBS 207.26]
MNLGPNAKEALKQQEPTYRIAPNFTTRPFPDGPLELGTLVEDIKEYYPINQGTDRVPIPDGQRYSDTKEDINASVKSSLGGEAGLLARVLDRGIGGELSLKGQRNDEDVYNIQKLETCLRLSDVKDYLDRGNYELPVYPITGLKIAWGATVSAERVRGSGADASIGFTVPGAPVNVSVGAKAGKIYHTKKLWSSEKAVNVERVRKGAVLVDDDQPIEVEDDEAEDEFVIADMDDEELAGLVKYTVQSSDIQNEAWYVPADVA